MTNPTSKDDLVVNTENILYKDITDSQAATGIHLNHKNRFTADTL